MIRTSDPYNYISKGRRSPHPSPGPYDLEFVLLGCAEPLSTIEAGEPKNLQGEEIVDLAQIEKALQVADSVARAQQDIEQAWKVAEPLSKVVVPNIAELNDASAIAKASRPFIDYDPIERIGEQLRNSSVANAMKTVGSIADAVNSVGAYTNWMTAVPAQDSWRPVLMRWAEPPALSTVNQYIHARPGHIRRPTSIRLPRYDAGVARHGPGAAARPARADRELGANTRDRSTFDR